MKRPCRVHGVISKSTSKLLQTAATALAILFCVHFAGLLDAADMPVPSALPSGGQIASGQGSVSTSGSSMRITQQSDKMIMNWQSFNIGQNASVNFVQPGSTSTALNRVVGSDPSGIYGSLTANGRVFLINPSGIIFGSTARVDVGGIVASTLNMKDSDFLIGSYNFYKDGAAGSIHNMGIISAKAAGFIAMLAPEIRNEGIVAADLGTVAFGAGEKMTLNFSGNSLLGITVEEGALNALVENKNLIQSDGGAVLMTARAANELALSAVNNEGIVRARSIQEKNGVIVLDSGQSGMTTISGTLDASSTDSKGGHIAAIGERVLVKSGSLLTATGALGGGEVLVGGSWQNSDTTVRQATGTVIEQGTLLQANATDTGNGGTVVAWSDITNPNSVTRAYGTFEAKGGPNGGDGGRIETSGHWLDVAGSQGGASAPKGQAGVWLFDPYDVTITTANANGSWGSAGGTDTWTPSGTSTILNTDINAKLNGGTSVTITTGSAGASLGDITVSSAIVKTTGNADVTLTLQAANSIIVNQPIRNTEGNGKLHILLDADNNNGSRDGVGIIQLNADIMTKGGNLSFGTGATLSLNGVSTYVGGDVYVAGAGGRTIFTGGGNVDVKGEMIIANTSGLTINSNNGNIRFYGLLNSGNQYAFVDKTGSAGTGSWSDARTEAINGTGGGSALNDSYLVTITSRLENSVAARAAGYKGAWIGAWRPNESTGAWVWSNGPEANQQFFTQTTNGSGGVTASGYYSNFGTGEPNGSMTISPTERVGQFFGTAAQWNDLVDATTYSATQTSPYAVLGFIRETNLAASPLTINAGSGTVTFSGAVGTSKALASLNVTSTNSIAINGGAVTTEGLQTYAGNVTLRSAATTLTQTNANTDFTLQAAKSITNGDPTGGNESLTIKTTGSIIMDTSSSISSSTGKLNTILWSDTDANGGYIWIKSGSSISTNSGHLWMGGGSGSATWNGLTVGNGYALGDSIMSNGILLDAVNISTSGGNMAYYGKSRAGAAAGGESGGLNSDGIRLGYSGNSTINSGTGTILFDGVAQGTDQNSIGFESCSVGSANNHTITSAATSGDAITIKGAGSVGASTQDWGIYLHTGTSITATGGGNIVFEGTTGGSQVATYINTSATANSNNGNLTITGDTLYVGGTLSGAGTLTVQPKTAGTTIGIAGGAGTGTLSLPASYFSTNFTNGFSGITIGKANAGAITVGTTTFNDSTTLLNNSTIAINGAVTANENLVLTSNGAITQSAALAVTGTTSITAGAANNVTLTNTSNNFTGAVSVVSGNNVSIIDSNAMTLGAVTSSGLVDIATLTNNLTLTGAVSTTNATVNAIKLNAGKSTAAGTSTGGDIVVSGGSVSVGAGGTAQLFTGSVSGSTGLTTLIGLGTSRFRYNSDESAANYTTALGAGLYALYREQPTVTVTASDASKAYDGLAYSGGNGVTYSGFVNGDTSATLGGTLSYAGTSQGAINPGTYTIAPSGYTNGLGYTLAYTNGTLSINKLALTATALDLSKAYNGSPHSGGNGVSYTGFASGDNSSVLSGVLSYSGTSQGAVSPGTYVIRPYGLTSSKYDFTYVDGVLTIAAAPYVPPAPQQIPAQQQSPAPASAPAVRQQSVLPAGMAVSFIPAAIVTEGLTILTTTSQLQPAIQGQALNQLLAAQGGTMPYTWHLVSGELPQELTLDPLSGELRGVPAASGIFSFEVEVIDRKSNRSARKLLLYVTGK